VTQTYELAEECLQINYYGAKITTESLLPLLKLSSSPRIVNVSSTTGKLKVRYFSPSVNQFLGCVWIEGLGGEGRGGFTFLF